MDDADGTNTSCGTLRRPNRIIIAMRYIAYRAVQAIWGFPQSLASAVVLAVHARRPHFGFHGAVVTTWKQAKGLSLGPFIFLHGSADLKQAPTSVNSGLLVHEYGHTIQSLILGPLYLPVIGIPSFIWSNTPALVRKRQREQRSYYSFWVERSANWLGEQALGCPSIGQAIVD